MTQDPFLELRFVDHSRAITLLLEIHHIHLLQRGYDVFGKDEGVLRDLLDRHGFSNRQLEDISGDSRGPEGEIPTFAEIRKCC